MKLFKKKTSEVVSEDATSTGGDVTQVMPVVQVSHEVKKRKPIEMLSSVLSESDDAAAVDLMRANEKFLVTPTLAMVLVLNADDIGGLNLKSRNDESKGSIVALIKGDQMDTLITPQMLSQEKLAFIPSHNTLERMDEFSLLINAPYTWASVDLEQFAIVDLAHGTYAQARDIDEDRVSVSDFYSELTGTYTTTIDDSVEEVVSEQEYVAEPEAEVVEPEAEFVDVFDEEPVFEDPDYDDIDYDDSDYEYDDSDDVELDEAELDAADDDSVSYDPDIVVDERAVQDTIARRFLSDGLDLSVDMLPFEHYFGAYEPLPKFPVEFGEDDWLGKQLSHLASQANTELEQAHQTNMQMLRQSYIQLMNRYVDNIQKMLDLRDPNTFYGKAMSAAEADRSAKEFNAEQMVAKRREELRAQFNAEMEERATAAAAIARSEFREYHTPRLENAMAAASVEVDRGRDEAYASARERVMTHRKIDAERRMDLGLTLALEALSAQHRENSVAEMRLREERMKQMQALVNENRQYDIARTETLRKQLEQSGKISELTESFDAQVAMMKQEHETRIEELNAELAALRASAEENLATREHGWVAKMERVQAKHDSARDTIEELTEKLTKADDRAERKYEGQSLAVAAERDRYRAELEDERKRGSRTQRFMVLLFSVLGLLLLLAGYLLGGSLQKQPATPTPVVQTVTVPAVAPTSAVTVVAPGATAASTSTVTVAPVR